MRANRIGEGSRTAFNVSEHRDIRECRGWIYLLHAAEIMLPRKHLRNCQSAGKDEIHESPPERKLSAAGDSLSQCGLLYAEPAAIH
jgi:hypothetical protein